ncbi:acid sphingomyelinase-like phosphodiesterase 3b [Pseudomyrmex gracilis]|uniref:acid sphingomyelinase-like phosphodiesterase 3b n=1 Tax=Pseudomyrmex gracilis TaxID=219809 RepID=UPI0009954C4C|nr:acid sphingomyelinase-like phosphodiesterase 3b [Pseudomyrmex gracilis]
MAKINELKFELFPQPAYLPDLASSDYHLFPNLKKWLGGKKLESNEEVINAVNEDFEELDISDYKNACWNTRNNVDDGRIRLDRKLAGKFGDYSCNSPWALIESAARAMRSKHSEGIEFVLWTGDALTRTADMSIEQRLQYLRNLTDLLHRTFKGQFVFPALGHEDISVNYTQLATLWQNWLPPEAVDTFVKGTTYQFSL